MRAPVVEFLIPIFFSAGAAAATHAPETFVNTLGGTDSRGDLSHGNTLPLVNRPWSFNAWAPQTASSGAWWFHPKDAQFHGVRCTHQPSPWIGDYGQFRVFASLTTGHSDPGQFSSYNPETSSWKPYYWNASLLSFGNRNGFTGIELTSTSHAAVMRVRFPSHSAGELSAGFNQTRNILIMLRGLTNQLAASNADPPGMIGFSTINSGGVVGRFRHFFHATVSGGVDGDESVSAMSAHTVSAANGLAYAVLSFDPSIPRNDVLTLRVGTSLISPEQAALNLQQEVGALSFDAVRAASQADWRAVLSRAKVVDVGARYTPVQQHDLLTTFYSSMWRAAQFPRRLSEVAANGTELHWSPYDGAVHVGPLSADSGFWDAVHTVYPMLSVVHPSVLGTLIQGWVNAYRESGWLPKWASPGHRSSMVGTLGDVSLADAIVKRIGGFDVASAYTAIRKDAYESPPPGVGNIGRTCLEAYLKDGYVAAGAAGADGPCSEAVSRSLNYYQSDFAVAQAAAELGFVADATDLIARAANFSRLFEPGTAFFRARASGMGAFSARDSFDEFAFGNDYTEAGPWQYRFYVPHDPKGLIALYNASGLDMCAVLQQAQTIPSAFHIGGYGAVIHEMTEMPALAWGQYQHGNQPAHHMLWMFIAADTSVAGACASQGQFWLRRALTTLYKPGADMFCGDEDNGEMSSWYILAALGLYSLAPGSAEYVLGAPLFAHVQIKLDGSAGFLDIVAPKNGPDRAFVRSVSWNGKSINGTTVSYFDLMAGGTLSFAMADSPPSGISTAPVATSAKTLQGFGRLSLSQRINLRLRRPGGR